MQQIYSSSKSNPILHTGIRFFLNAKGRLSKITWSCEIDFDDIRGESWGNEEQETWDFNDANENDLIHAFKELAFGNPADFKELYFTLKEHDKLIFPIIQKTLKELQELFNFD